MKKSLEIIGLPIISITEGKELGKVKELVINSLEGMVAALVVDDGKWYLGAKFLPFSSVAGMGESAIIADGSDTIVNIVNAPDLEKLLEADIKIVGTKVITKTGRINGKVAEIIIDETGKIIVCEMESTNGEIINFDTKNVVTFGKDALIVTDIEKIPAPAMAAPHPVEQVTAIKPNFIPEAPAFKEFPKELEDNTREKAADDSAKIFDDKNRKYLLGKKTTRRIEADNGTLIIDKGGEITEEVLQKAKLAGKFAELSKNIQY